MDTHKEKFASQADPRLLAAVRHLAAQEGRQLQSLLEEALRDLVEKKQSGKPRRHVLNAFENSLREYDDLYRKLAK